MESKSRYDLWIKLPIIAIIVAMLYIFEFTLGFLPEFYTVDFSSAILLISSYSVGPVAGIIMAVIKCILKLLIVGSKSAYVAEFTDLIVTILFIFPAVIIYNSKRRFKNAVIGVIAGLVLTVIAGVILNYFVLLPIYAPMMGTTVNAIIEDVTAINSKVVSLKTLIVYATIPYNLIKYGGCSVIALILMRPASVILEKPWIKQKQVQE